MKRHLLIALVFAAAGMLDLCAADSRNNTLTDTEKAAGWKLLFDGEGLKGWHNFKREGVRPGWQV